MLSVPCIMYTSQLYDVFFFSRSFHTIPKSRKPLSTPYNILQVIKFCSPDQWLQNEPSYGFFFCGAEGTFQTTTLASCLPCM